MNSYRSLQAIRGGGKDAKLIEILKNCTKEIENLVHDETEG